MSRTAAIVKALRNRGNTEGLPQGVDHKVWKAFIKIDTNESGVLDPEEMVSGFEQLGRGVTGKQSERLIAECGPLVNQNTKLVDEDGKCNGIDVYGL